MKSVILNNSKAVEFLLLMVENLNVRFKNLVHVRVYRAQSLWVIKCIGPNAILSSCLVVYVNYFVKSIEWPTFAVTKERIVLTNMLQFFFMILI